MIYIVIPQDYVSKKSEQRPSVRSIYERDPFGKLRGKVKKEENGTTNEKAKTITSIVFSFSTTTTRQRRVSFLLISG